MKIPVELKPGLWGALAGAIGISVLGFTQLGWVGPGNAAQLARDAANTAVVAAIVPFCVGKARSETEAAALTKLRGEQSTYSRGDIVARAGWASADGKSTDNNTLARACADKLAEAKAG